MTGEDYQIIFHEIKNNVTFIGSSLQLLEKKYPAVREISYWNDAMEEIHSMKKMLIDLSSARLTDSLDLKRTTPERFLEEFGKCCGTAFDQSRFRCEILCEASLPEIEIDFLRLKRAFMNLLKNSYEAMGAKGTVKLCAKGEESFVRFDLIDFGCGISPDYLPKLFAPFETTKEDGTGLGLLIAKRIIESHGGHIEVNSRPQSGCTFSIFLPFASHEN